MKHLGGEKKRLKLEKLNENFHSEKIRKTKSREIWTRTELDNKIEQIY